MAWDDPNVYSTPEKFGLTIVEVVDQPGLSYEYNTAVLWQDAGGNYYWARDSGCSCPIPFEDYRTLADLNQGLHGWEEAKAAVLLGRWS